MKIKNQSLLKKCSSGFDDEKLSTCALVHMAVHDEDPITGTVFNQSLVEIFSSRSAENFSIKVRLKNKNQGFIDLRAVFNHDLDRDEKNLLCRKHWSHYPMTPLLRQVVPCWETERSAMASSYVTDNTHHPKWAAERVGRSP
ncbi:hypothetical protein [uncultured Methanoregula sp.]|uniref:hypothetical protein n=1 Tax=uncultured Methanoregula sp. TaxID=1005933 RepID=UPI002AAC2DDB|nr:hypothetical protein [uncultured Methanoregula sp.]